MIEYSPGFIAENSEIARFIIQELTRIADSVNSGIDNEPLRHAIFAVADLPDATYWTGATVYVSDEAGGATMAFSDGTNWRRVQDRAICS